MPSASSPGDTFPHGAEWVLESVKGRLLIEFSYITIEVAGDSITGYDGCNWFGGRSEDGKPVAAANGTFTSPSPLASTLRGCAGLEPVMEQEAAFREELGQAARFRIVNDQLELLNEAGEVTLVFAKQTELPGQSTGLEGTVWQPTGESGGDAAGSLAFLDGEMVAGTTVCRDFVATYQISEGGIGFPNIAMVGTAPNCSGALRESESRLTVTLGSDYAIAGDGDSRRLTLGSSEGGMQTLAPLPPAVEKLDAATWRLKAFVNRYPLEGFPTPRLEVMETLSDTGITLSIYESGVGGLGGCNSYGDGEFRVEGQSLTIEGLLATNMECVNPPGVMEQEMRYFDLLDAVTGFRIYGDRLFIHTDDGRAAVFEME